MPYTHEILPTRKLAVVTASSEINLADCIKEMHEVARTPNFKPWYDVLVDLRTVSYTPTLFESYQLARTLRELRRTYSGPMAIVVSNSPHLGISKTIGSFVESSGMKLGTFTTVEEAQRWLAEQTTKALPTSSPL